MKYGRCVVGGVEWCDALERDNMPIGGLSIYRSDREELE